MTFCFRSILLFAGISSPDHVDLACSTILTAMYGPDAFCKLPVRDVKTVCTRVFGLHDGRLPKHARSLDEIRAPRP